MKKGYAFAGANAFLAKKITTVKETIDLLKLEFQKAVKKEGKKNKK